MQRANDLAYRSLRLNSNSAIAPTIAAWTEMIMGNPGKAIELYHHADRLSPRDPRGWLIATSLGLAHFYEGRFGDAKSCAEKALVHNPRFADAQNEPRNAAGVTKRLWEIGDIVDMLEAWEQSGCARG